ncbi:hypothetical protein MTR67_031932, partial [Solanum verrucosum]
RKIGKKRDGDDERRRGNHQGSCSNEVENTPSELERGFRFLQIQHILISSKNYTKRRLTMGENRRNFARIHLLSHC